jgi:dipeptidyl aminopeptidase/acylaminoacyl peptidase
MFHGTKAFSMAISTAFAVGSAVLAFSTDFAAYATSQAAGQRPIVVSDDVTMTVMGALDDSVGGSSVAHFSPDGKWFVIVPKKANLEQDTNDSSLLLYKTVDVLQSPKPDLLLKMSSPSDREAIANIHWLADNRTIVFLGEDPGEDSQIYSFSILTRRLEKLTKSPTPITNYDITPDGRNIAFVTDAPVKKPECAEESACGEIVIQGRDLFDILTGQYAQQEGSQVFWQPVGHSPLSVPVDAAYVVGQTKMSLSPDGRYLLFSAHLRDFRSQPVWENYENADLKDFFAAHLLKGTNSPWQQHLLFDSEDMSSAPLINAPILGPDSFSWAEDGKSLFLRTYLPLDDVADPTERKARERRMYPIKVRLPSREYREVNNEDVQAGTQAPPLNVTLEQDLNTPPKLYVSDRKREQKTLLLDLNPQFKDLDLGVVKTIEWKAGGTEMLGGLYLPRDYAPGKRYPLVIQTHGFEPGEFSMDGRSEWSSAFAARPLAARGFVVLQADEFKNRQDHDRVYDDRKLGATPGESFRNFNMLSFEGAIDYLDRRGLIDLNRVGIVGFSRTACFVGYTLTHSKRRFAAAILVDGISCGYFEEMALPGEAWDIDSINGGASPFGSGLKVWMKNSPGFNLDKVEPPVRLVALGSGSVLSGWEWYAGLTMQRKPVDFVLVPGANHIGVKPSEREWSQQGIVDWFSFWLEGKEDLQPAKRNQYIRWRELRKEYSEAIPGSR